MSTTATQPDLDGLRLVVEAVRNAPLHRFCMSTWLSCGTSACAVGWFCKTHPDDALKLSPYGRSGRVLVPRIGDDVGYMAVAIRFGIALSQAEDLFSERSEVRDNCRSAVIARIEQFIREHETA